MSILAPWQLVQQRDEARLAHDISEATLSMAVSRLGGEVEGAPTGRHNFLQRIDELRRVEEEYVRLKAASPPPVAIDDRRVNAGATRCRQQRSLGALLFDDAP